MRKRPSPGWSAGFRASLPEATVYVYDNGSNDATMSRVADAGAVVRTEPTPGKGNVVSRMFADVDAELAVTSLVQLAIGLILDSVARGRVEAKRLAYLQIR